MEKDREAAKKAREKEEAKRRAAATAEAAEAERKAATAATAAEKERLHQQAEENRRKREREEEERRKREKQEEERQRRKLELEIREARVAAADATLGLAYPSLSVCVAAGFACLFCLLSQLDPQLTLPPLGLPLFFGTFLFSSATEDETEEEQDGRARCYRIQRTILQLTPTILTHVFRQAWNNKMGKSWSTNRL